MPLTSQEKKERAETAARLMSHALMAAAFEGVKHKYLDALVNTRMDQPEVRERAFALIKALEDVRSHLQTHIAEGELTAAQERKLEGKQSLTDKVMSYGRI